MKKSLQLFPLLLLIALVAPAGAEVDWQARNTIKPDSPPIDVAISADGKQTFVLSEGGKLNIYDDSGKLVDTIKVDPAMNRIDTDETGNRVLLGSTKNGTVHELQIEFIVAMDYAGSPFLGKSDAPVVLAVFSDFQ